MIKGQQANCSCDNSSRKRD